jgi:hypothetical protein
MSRYQHIIGSLDPQHLDPHQRRSNCDGMHTVDAHCVHPLKPRQCLSLLVCEASVGTQISHGSAGFNPTQNVLFPKVLALNRDGGLAVDAGTAKTPQNDGWESQSLPG